MIRMMTEQRDRERERKRERERVDRNNKSNLAMKGKRNL